MRSMTLRERLEAADLRREGSRTPEEGVVTFEEGGGPSRNRTGEWKICSLLPYRLAKGPPEGSYL